MNILKGIDIKMNEETKICTKCGRELPIDRFQLMKPKNKNPYYDLGVKTLLTDCFVLRTSTILPPHSQSMGPPPHFLLMCGRVNKVYLHLHASMTWRIPFDTVIILFEYL